MDKKKLTFITNIPSPYNLDLFEALAKPATLSVFYYSSIESERQWSLSIESSDYFSEVFRKDFFHHLFQKINRNLYFNFHCIRVALRIKSDYFILGGNYFAPNTLLLLLLLRLRHQKVFWYGEKLLPSSSSLIYLLKRILILPVNLFTEAIFAVGEGAVASYRNYGYKNQIFNIPYSINNNRFDGVEKYELIEGGKIIFLSSGSLIYRKGYDLAIQAFNLLDNKIKSKVEYWILGDGPLLTHLQSLSNPGLIVRFMGFVDPSSIPKYFNCASAFLLTSRYDGWGVVVNEAIAAGLPLIVTNTCGAAEYVNNENGFVVNCDAQEISEKISYLVLNPKTSLKFSEFNIQLAQSISSDSISRRLMEYISNF